jgi:hypothetical protein
VAEDGAERVLPGVISNRVIMIAKGVAWRCGCHRSHCEDFPFFSMGRLSGGAILRPLGIAQNRRMAFSERWSGAPLRGMSLGRGMAPSGGEGYKSSCGGFSRIHDFVCGWIATSKGDILLSFSGCMFALRPRTDGRGQPLHFATRLEQSVIVERRGWHSGRGVTHLVLVAGRRSW